MDHIDNFKHKCLALKQTNGETLDKFVGSYTQRMAIINAYKLLKVKLMTRNSSHSGNNFVKHYTTIYACFPCTDLLAAACVLEQSHWPEGPLKRALYGEEDV